MPKTIQAGAVIIRDDLLAAEKLSEQAAAAQARLIATLLETRASIGRQLDVGAREIDRGYQALGRTLGSMRSLMIMHEGLGEIAKAEGVTAWYGAEETISAQTPHLRAVG